MRSGFTLVELLAVVAIIAITASLLFAATMSSKRAALVTHDISSLRQIGQARSIYTSDYDNVEVTQIAPLVDSSLVSPELVRSRLDPTDVGYSNLFGISRGIEPLKYKVSYVTMADAERTSDPTPIPERASRAGWLVSAAHGLDLSQDNLIPSFFEGKYLRLCLDGSVISSKFYWHMVDVDGNKQWAVNVSRSFYDLPEGSE